jgi:undecaprenyl-diphosphatase
MRAILFIFLVSVVALCSMYLFIVDRWQWDAIVFIQQNSNRDFIPFLQALTDSISFVSIGIPLFVLIVSEIKKDKSNRKKVLLVLICLAVSGIVSSSIKSLTKKPRPFTVDSRIEKLSGGGSYSFPSGHTTEAVTAAIVMIFFWRNWYVALFYTSWASLIMFSRMALGVHDLFDLIGGIAVASGSMLLVIKVDQKRSSKKKTI